MKKVLILIVVFVFFTTPAFALGIRDQGQIFGTGGTLDLGTDQWSQSITTAISGQLIEIEIQFWAGVPPSPPALNLSIFGGGNPISGSALFTEQLFVTDADLDSDQLFIWETGSANLFFDAGDVFSFVLEADGTGYSIAGNDPPGYDGGTLFKNGTSYSDLSDIAFRTYVTVPGSNSTPIPEPGTIFLFGTGIFGIVGFVQKKRK